MLSTRITLRIFFTSDIFLENSNFDCFLMIFVKNPVVGGSSCPPPGEIGVNK
jgi:hypothetical protein